MSILPAFDHFRSTLDAHYDKRERLIKLSRDITALSKKMIFLLHRLSLMEAPSYTEAVAKETEIRTLFNEQAKEFKHPGSQGEFWRYQNNITGGLQEYIEAVSFLHYLTTDGSLISIQDIQRNLSDKDGKPFFPVTSSDYILGLSDLSGELMRLTLNAIAKGRHEVALKTLSFVRELKSQFDQLTGWVPYLDKKQEITDQSLRKIETAAYQISLRRREFAGQEDVLAEMIRRDLESDQGAEPAGGNAVGTKRGRAKDDVGKGREK